MYHLFILADADRSLYASFWKTSTPDSKSPQPVTFKSDRVSAWLVQTPRLCSRAVQTEHAPQVSSTDSTKIFSSLIISFLLMRLYNKFK